MSAGERELRLAVMIEAHALPGGDLVAVGAARLLHPLRELARVRVRVACVAAGDVPRRVELGKADLVLAAAFQDPRAKRRGARFQLRLGAMAEVAGDRFVRPDKNTFSLKPEAR